MLEATTPGIRPAGYERPRVEAVLSSEDLEREVMAGGPGAPSRFT